MTVVSINLNKLNQNLFLNIKFNIEKAYRAEINFV